MRKNGHIGESSSEIIMADEIGGYFELELQKGKEYHSKAIALNTARNCLEYILRARKYKKIYIPYYTCDAVLEPLNKLQVQYEFYHINEKLEPIDFPQLNCDEAFLYTNYFGLKQTCVESLAYKYGSNLIVDNAQAFFAPRIDGIDTFYSPRKFLGVADGGYLYTDCLLDIDLEQDYSYDRMSHLLKRIDLSAEKGYSDFKSNSKLMVMQPIKKMSKLTSCILSSINYDKIKKRRRNNYSFLGDFIGHKNNFHIQLREEDVPMIYPFYTYDVLLKRTLIENRIFVATYWPNVLKWTSVDSIEYMYADRLLAIPVDQRYTQKHLNIIIDNILKNGK